MDIFLISFGLGKNWRIPSLKNHNFILFTKMENELHEKRQFVKKWNDSITENN